MSENVKDGPGGKISSRVMNMKFMRHAEQVDEVIKEEEHNQHRLDFSRWKLNDNRNSGRISKVRKVVSVGYTCIRKQNFDENKANDSSGAVRYSNLGRRVFMGLGQKKADESDSELDEVLRQQIRGSGFNRKK